MRRVLALVFALAACGKIAVGGGPEGGGPMEQTKPSGEMVMLTLVLVTAAVVGLLVLFEEQRKPATN